jgi:hypothetical protein
MMVLLNWEDLNLEKVRQLEFVGAEY